MKHSHTARVQKKESVFEIARRMVDAGQVYLRHRSNIENINRIFSVIK